MNSFVYRNPVKVIFGAGKLAEAGAEALKLGKKAFIVSYSDPNVAGTLERVYKSLEESGVEYKAFLEVTPNPPVEMIEKGVAQAKEFRAELVIGVGGGSAMDAAKALAAGVLYEYGDLWNMVYANHANVTIKPPEKALPIMQIPTLSATGSEMNMCSVLSSTKRKQKSYIWSECLFAQTAILDPELTYSLPKFQTACGGVDAISHVLEIFINGQDKSDLLHEFQLGVIRTIVKNLPIALEDPTNADARAELMWAATCGINGWASPGDAWTPMHQIGHVLTSLHGVNHGCSLAVIMPTWMRHFASIKPAPYARFERDVMSINDFEAFIKSCGLPTTLTEVGISEADIPGILKGVKDVSFNADGVLSCNPPVSEETILEILKKAL